MTKTKLNDAISFAADRHNGQVRKGTNVPYIVHPIEVMDIVCRLTGSEDVRCAAVLHDTVEDTGTSVGEIKELFGERVAALVSAESENKREGLPEADTWLVRKQETLNHLSECTDTDVKLICFGDKLANLRAIARDKAALGEKVWERFNVCDPGLIGWYYKCVLERCPEVESVNSSLYTEYARLLKGVWG